LYNVLFVNHGVQVKLTLLHENDKVTEMQAHISETQFI